MSVSLGIQFSNAITSLNSDTIMRKAKAFVNQNIEYSKNQIKFFRKANPTYTLSDGQVKKKIADYTRLKYYSKIESEKTINCILETYFNFEDYSVRISSKTKAEAIDVLSKKLNTLGISAPINILLYFIF